LLRSSLPASVRARLLQSSLPAFSPASVSLYRRCQCACL
jgi:hypothetical protein